MPQTHQSIVVDAPIDTVWEKVRDFHDMSWAPNVVTRCVAEGDTSGTQVGARRLLNDVFHETLIELDEDAYRIRYTIDEGPSPISRPRSAATSNTYTCRRSPRQTRPSWSGPRHGMPTGTRRWRSVKGSM